MTFGKYKTWMFKEVPQNYLEWAVQEVDANQGASPELVHFADWSRGELASRKAKAENAVGVSVDPEVSAVIPVPEMDASVRSAGSVMTWKTSSSAPKASNVGKVAETKQKASPNRGKREAETVEITDGMDVQVPVEVVDELETLDARAASLRREHHLPPGGRALGSQQ